ncbi:unnamed protein product [Brugia pahangi]|uniref:PBP_domain domain-containing protein n=1 Tax=Brugia pahangi TaxID=6280 RepID=A0A0N4TTL6_BRUPA|nr:unnamed protein product [Brugia pahangi]
MEVTRSKLKGLSNPDARKYVGIVGSSTVFPFMSFIAEDFNCIFSFKTPVVESIESRPEFKIFCSGIRENALDIATSSCPVKEAEIERERDVIIISYTGMSLQIRIKAINLILKRIYLKLYLHILKRKSNKKLWSDINQTLPKTGIEICDPHQNTGTYETLVNFVTHA